MRLQIIFCLYAGLTTEIYGKDVRILGGENTNAEEYPFMASFRYAIQNIIFCGGAIISNKHILTAAHCLYEKQHEYHKIRIYTGITATRSINGGVHEILRVSNYPEFTGSITGEALNHHDISVVEVKEIIQFNVRQSMIALPGNDNTDNIMAWVIGWGSITHPKDTSPEQLQKTRMRILPKITCLQNFPFKIHPEQFCAYMGEGIGVCVGDSGGPMVIANQIVGIVSVNFPCAKGIPDVYTSVYSYLDFIRSIIGT